MRYLRLVSAALLGAVAMVAQVDPTSPTDGFTPASIAPGTPQGTTLLSAHEAVNLYRGNLSFTIPLHSVQGRGGDGYTMTLPIGTKWNIQGHLNSGQPIYLAIADIYPFDNFPAATSVARYTPGRVILREVVDETGTAYKCVAGYGNGYTVYTTQTLTRLTWTEPDGTEHELKDTLNAGQPLPLSWQPGQLPAYNCLHYDPLGKSAPIGPSRGTVFVSDDATAATFIASGTVYDATTTWARNNLYGKGVAGWLLFKDGTRYHTGTGGVVDTIVDRNGNTTTIGSSGVTDSLGRTTTVTTGGGAAGSTDTIQYPGAGGTLHTITVHYDYMANHLRSGMAIQTMSSLFPATNNSGSFNPVVVSSVVLPDQSSYTIQYNPYGEVSRVTLPGGGAYEYDYPTTTPFCSGNASGCVVEYNPNGNDVEYRVVYRRVTARRVYPNGSTMEGETCYAPSYSISPSTTTTVQVTKYDSTGSSSCTSGTVIGTETHVFAGDPTTPGNYNGPPAQWYADWTQGRETQSSWKSAGGTTLKSTATTWGADATGFNPTVCQTVTTLDGVSTSGNFTVNDEYFNPADSYEYDFGSAPPVPGVPTVCPSAVPSGYGRHSHTSYIADGVYDVVVSDSNGPNAAKSNHMRNLVQEKDVYDGSGSLVAKTTYGYDENVTTEPGTPTGYLTPAHMNRQGTQVLRGNLTSKTAWLDATSTKWTTTYGRDNLGNVVSITDPRTDPGNHTTTISYADSCSAGPGGTLDALPTSVTNPLSQKVSIAYDCYLGKQTTFKDANNISTIYSYSGDPFDRLLSATRASGTAVQTATAFTYPNPTTVTAKQDQTSINDGAIQSTTLYL